jgi:hypothetical protein
VTGLYNLDLTPTPGNGFEAGKTYTVIATYTVDALTKSELFTFTCT